MRALRLAVALAAALVGFCPCGASAAVGHTAGTFSVTPTGAATYSVPLWTPPGIGAIAPSLTLGYASSRGPGLVGMGLGIGGLSEITRCARTLAQDRGAAAPDLGAGDRFCLDGARLRLVSGVHGADGSTYATETESFARITARGVAGTGPASFVVEQADGLVYEYGTTADSRVEPAPGVASARHWALAQVRDRSGNAMRYRYTEDTATAQHRIAAIEYPYTASGAGPYYRVEFQTESRAQDDILGGYWAGHPWREDQRLARIRMLAWNGGWQPLRRYEIAYESVATGRARVASLTECDGASQCLAPTRLGYYDGYPGWLGESVTTLSPAPLDASQVLWLRTGADGNDDLVYQSQERDQFWLVRGGAWSAGAFGSGTTVVRRGDLRAADMDGDLREDLAYRVVAGGFTRVYVLRASGTGLAPAALVATLAGQREILFADLDGDGRDELLHAAAGGATLAVRSNQGGVLSASDATAYTLPSGQGFAVGAFAAHAPQARFRSSHRRADFTGETREDLVVFTCPASTPACLAAQGLYRVLVAGGSPGVHALVERASLASTTTPLLTDVDGDGLTDLAYAGVSGLVMLRQGTGVGVSAEIGTGQSSSGFATALAADWNGDGRLDLLLPAGTRWNVLPARGNGLAAPQATNLVYAAGQARRVFGQSWAPGGVATLGYVLSGKLRRNEGYASTPPDALLSVKDGVGVGAQDIIYAATGHAGLPVAFARGLGVAGQRVVGAYVTDGSGSGQYILTSYDYLEPRIDRNGRGFLGYAKVSASGLDEDYQQIVATETEYHQDFPLTGRPSRVRQYAPSGALLSEVEQAWATLPLGVADELRVHAYAASSKRREWEVGLPSLPFNGEPFEVEESIVNAIDPVSGLVTDVTTTSKATATSADPGATRTQRLVHSSVFNDIGNWCLGRPQATQSSQSHTLPGGSIATRRAAATWDGQYCRPTEVTLEPGDPEWQLRHSLAYDVFGNLSRQTLTGAGVPARTTAASFGTRGQFPESLTNALGQVEAWSWRSDLGVPAASTDANGLVTAWTYDSFGRRTQESRADGTRSRVERHSCANAECGDSTVRYRLSVTELDTAGQALRADEQLIDHHGRVIGSRWPAADGRQAGSLRRFDLRGRVLREDLPAYVGEQAPGYLLHAYDERGRHGAVTRADALGRSDAVTVWQHSGFEVTTTDPRGVSSTRYTAPWGSIVRAVDAAGGITRYEHNAFGQLLRVIDAAGSVVADIGYNVRGMKQGHADMDTGAWSFRNSAFGEVTAVRAPGTPSTEWTSTFTYDALGRMVGRSEPEGASSWTFGNSATLHNVGQLVAMSGPGHAEAYAYDAVGRLAQRSITSDATYRYDFTYNAEGRLDTLAYPETSPGRRLVLRHEYASGELVALRDAGNPATVPWQRVDVDAAGRITSELLGNGVLVQSGFGALDGRLASRRVELPGAVASPDGSTPGPLADLGWDWDASGNLVARHDRLRGHSESFGYDALGRLSTASLNGVPTLSVAHDITGNITHKSDVGAYSYHATRRHAVTSAGTNVFAYDARGQMSSRNGSAISWASYGLPKSIAGTGGSSSQFLYDAARERYRQVSTAGGVTEQTHYIGGLLEKVVRNGVTEWKHYVVAPTGTAALYRRAGDGTAETLYFTQDHLGSTHLVLDAAGAVLRVEQGFDAFGRRRGAGMTGVPSQADWSAIAASTRDGYTGHEHLDNLGLVHMGGRVYDPVVGRFLSVDPFVQAPWDGQSLNRYAYVFNNPLSYTDPTGFQAYVPAGHDSPVDLYFGANGAQTLLPLFGFNFGGGLTQRCISQCVANDVAWEQRWVADARAQAAAQPFARDPGASGQPVRDFAAGMVNRLWMDALRLADADALADVLETYVAGTPDSPEGQFGADLAPAVSLVALRKGSLRLLGLEGRALTVAERQAAMLKSNVGYNVSPSGWFSKYATIGASRTAVTDREAIRSVIGRFRAGQFYTVGARSGPGRVTYDEAARLEKALGLNPQSLKNGFKITKIGNLSSRSPRAPLEGNAQFLGRGRGLPGGGPEIEIDPVPTGF